MAIIKEIITKDGFSADYWKIGMFTIDKNLKEANFSLNLYYTKEDSIMENKFVDSFSCTSLMGKEDKSLFNQYFNNTDWEKSCYEYAMAHEDFFKDGVSDEVVA